MAIAAGAIGAAPAARAGETPMSFNVVSLDAPECGDKCPEVIVADGVIEESTPQAFVDFLVSASQTGRLNAVIYLNSPGGNVVASMELGKDFRKVRAVAIVSGVALQDGRLSPAPGQCLSACVYALMGARRRVVPATSRVGLHRMSVYEPSDSAPHGDGLVEIGLADRHLVTYLARYAARMGVSPALVWRAESLLPGVLDVLDRKEIARWRLASARL